MEQHEPRRSGEMAVNREARSQSPSSSGRPVIAFLTPDSASPELLGSKAARLSRLATAGFDVPEGFVLTTAAFEQAVEVFGFERGSRPEDVTDTPLPAAVAGAIEEGLERLGPGPVAVRSSSVAEDLVRASFAGQYETVLGVEGSEAVASAVRRCWSSAFSEHAAHYRSTLGEQPVSPMAVLIQRLVPADAAGVVFTADPLTFDRSQTLVSAVRGLGERLVSGTATPDEWLVRDGYAEARVIRERAVSAAEAVAVARLARRVEEVLGEAPLDIEWVLAGGEIVLLQARPVTAPVPDPQQPALEIPPGFWMRDLSHFPDPISPMAGSFYLHSLEESMTKAFKEFGLLLDRMETRVIGGYPYAKVVPIGAKEGPPPPWWLMGLLAKTVPPMRAAVRRAVDAARNRKGDAVAERWWRQWRAEFFDEIASLQEVELKALDDAALEIHLDRTRAFLDRAQEIHFLLFIPYMHAVAGLALFCERELGWEARESMELLGGLSEMSTEPSIELAELARMARERPLVLEVLERLDHETRERLSLADPDFAEALDEYQQRFGCRALSEDVIDPTLAERPEVTLEALRGQLTGDYDPSRVTEELRARRNAKAAEARRLLGSATARRANFDELLEQARRMYPLREDNSFPTYGAANGLVRYALLELGRRLAGRGAIESSEDVMYLELDEARSALWNPSDLRERVERCKAERCWALANPGPATYGKDPGPPPDMRALPRPVRGAMEALSWFIANDIQAPRPGGEGLVGLPASPGRYRGPVRIVRHEGEFHKLRSGDVLVCPITSPAWSVLFSIAGALVTEIGGVLSHSAIIAREYRMPAVVATGHATTLLEDGQVVTVDGSSGRIEVNDR